jgi:hypothetical protein
MAQEIGVTMEMVVNEALWNEAFLDTPFGRGADTIEKAFTTPGNCVKSIERDAHICFPKYHGVLVKYGEECVVRGHNSPVSDMFVWTGTEEEYRMFWEVD